MTTATLPDVDRDSAKKLKALTRRIRELKLEQEKLLIEMSLLEDASLRELGELADMSHVGVKKLIDRRLPDFIIEDEDGNVYVIEVKEGNEYAIPIKPHHGSEAKKAE